MLKSFISFMCSESEKFAYWILGKDIDKISKTLHNLNLGKFEKDQADKIASLIMWNSPDKIISSLENIEYNKECVENEF